MESDGKGGGAIMLGLVLLGGELHGLRDSPWLVSGLNHKLGNLALVSKTRKMTPLSLFEN